MQDIGEAVVAALVHGGIKRVYMVPCDLVWLLKAIEASPDLKLISVRHESSAAYMAEADAKLSGSPACVVTGRSVGATNASNGVETARDGSVPMLILMNDVETTNVNREAFQKMDLTAFYRPITKRSLAAGREDSLPDMVSDALRLAKSGRPGPVMLTIPSDLLGVATPWVPRVLGGLRMAPEPSPQAIEDIARRVNGARRPVIIAGGGARTSRAELIAVAEKYNAGVYLTFRRQDVFPNDHPLYLGHLAMATPPETLVALREADLVLVIGSKLSQMTTQRFTLPLPSAQLIQIDIDPARVGVWMPATVGVVSEAKLVLRGLLEQPGTSPKRDWSQAHETFIKTTLVPPDRAKSGVDPSQVIKAMAEVLPADSIMTSEAGGYATFLHQHWLFRHPESQAAPATGTMGYSVPAAVALKLIRPERCVVALVGDGGFLMNGQEIESAMRYGAAVIVVIFNNRLLSGGGYLDSRRYTHISNVDFATYARAFGAQGITVDNQADLVPAFKAALGSKTVTVIDVKTDPTIISPNGRPLMMAGPLAQKVDTGTPVDAIAQAKP